MFYCFRDSHTAERIARQIEPTVTYDELRLRADGLTGNELSLNQFDDLITDIKSIWKRDHVK